MSHETERYEDEVGEIRDRMIRRIDQLADEFTPQSLIAKATGNPDAGIDDAIEIAADTVRRNPLSAALIGAGVLGIIATRAADRVTVRSYDEADVGVGVEGVDADGRRYAASGTRRQTLNEKISERTAQMTQKAKSKVDELKTQASDLVSDAGETIKDTAQSVKAAAADTIDSTRDTLKETAEDLGRRGREASDAAVRKTQESGHWIKNNPVATGLMVMAAGAAIGSVLTARRNSSDPGETAGESLEREANKKENEKDGRKGAERFEQIAREAEPTKPVKSTAQRSTAARPAKTGVGSPASSNPTVGGGTPNGTTESKTSVGTSRS
jgi:ElaB/YqjD/DUF883 family membrane-anchored ribosome-binding protein